MRVAIQGEAGSNSAQAAQARFGPQVHLVACADFAALFAAVRAGRADCGVAPVENSLAGSIHPVWDLLAEQAPPISGEFYFRVRHFLIGHPGARAEDIRRAHSHGQALAQCAAYLEDMGIEAVEEYDTAGAVGLVKERGGRDEAAIAPAAAARLHGMEVLAENIQTHPHNYTRFLVLAGRPQPAGEGPLKTTLIGDMAAGAAGLSPLLAALADHRICKVETRKLANIPWSYRCYVECMGALTADALEAIGAQLDNLCALAPYPAAAPPPAV